MTDTKSTGRPRIFARVDPATRRRIEDLGAEYPSADGEPGTISDVTRAFVDDGEALLDRALRDRARSAQRRLGLASMAATWRAVIEAGLAAVEVGAELNTTAPSPRRSGA